MGKDEAASSDDLAAKACLPLPDAATPKREVRVYACQLQKNQLHQRRRKAVFWQSLLGNESALCDAEKQATPTQQQCSSRRRQPPTRTAAGHPPECRRTFLRRRVETSRPKDKQTEKLPTHG